MCREAPVYRCEASPWLNPSVRQTGMSYMNDNKSTRWFCAQTRENGEYVAETEMRRVGLTVYLPQFRREYLHHRRKVLITRQFPLFPDYLFLVADKLDWVALATCKGLEREPILRDINRKPLFIDGAIIDKIRNSEECGEFDELRTAPARLHVGEKIKIADGALSGMEGPLSRVKSGKHVQMLISLFNTQVPVTASLAKLQKAS